MRECTEYVEEDSDDRLSPCRCPVCMGFLTSNIFQDPLICKKCGSELAALPNIDEETGEESKYGDGKICVITRRKKTTTQDKHSREINKLIKEGHEKWKGLL
jgi:hypothetical protein